LSDPSKRLGLRLSVGADWVRDVRLTAPDMERARRRDDDGGGRRRRDDDDDGGRCRSDDDDDDDRLDRDLDRVRDEYEDDCCDDDDEDRIRPGVYRILTTHHSAGQQPAGWGLACFPNCGAKRNDGSTWVHVHAGDHWPCEWEIKRGEKRGTWRVITLGHRDGGQVPGWGLSAWHAHGAERNGASSWSAVHEGDKWPMDWEIVPGHSRGTWRFLTTEHHDGRQPAGWGLAAWNAHGAKRNDVSSRVAVHEGDHWPMNWVLERIRKRP